MNSKHERDENCIGSVMSTQEDKNAKTQTKEETVFEDLLHVLGFTRKRRSEKNPPSASPSQRNTKVEEQSTTPSDDVLKPHEPPQAIIPPHSESTEKIKMRSDNDTAEEISPEENVDVVPPGDDTGLAMQSVSAPKKRISRKTLCFVAAAAVVGVGFYFTLPYLTEPVPPGEDVVATYSGKSITIEELKKLIVMEQAKEMEHAYCQVHGYDHSKCDPSEECEKHPIDTLEGYRQMATNFAVEQIMQEWAAAQGITERDDVQHGLKDMLENASVNQLLEQLHETEITPESISSWEVQQYYDSNMETYTGKSLSEVEDEIRQILVSQKDADFFTQYIDELKQTAGLQVNLELLKVSEPTDDEISAYYKENVEQMTVPETARVLEIRITSDDAKSLGTEAIRKIRSGESFESVASTYDPEGVAGELTVTKDTSDDAVSAAVFQMQPGDISDPITNADLSVSILKLSEVIKAGAMPLSDVKPYIRLVLLQGNMDSEYALRKDEALFTVHGRRYTLGEFYTEFKELPMEYQTQFSTYEQKQQLVEQLIAKELLLEKNGDGSANETDDHQMEELKIQYIAQIIHQQEVDDKLTTPTEEEIRKFYEENKKSFVTPASVQISLIWIDQGAGGEKAEQARTKAEEALALLKSGTDFSEVAKQYSEDSSGTAGGDISGEYDQAHLPEQLGNAVFALKPGENTDILDYDFGYYIIKVRQRNEETQMTYEESADGIQAHLGEQKHAQMESQMEQILLKNANFIVYEKTLRKLLDQQNQ